MRTTAPPPTQALSSAPPSRPVAGRELSDEPEPPAAAPTDTVAVTPGVLLENAAIVYVPEALEGSVILTGARLPSPAEVRVVLPVLTANLTRANDALAALSPVRVMVTCSLGSNTPSVTENETDPPGATTDV